MISNAQKQTEIHDNFILAFLGPPPFYMVFLIINFLIIKATMKRKRGKYYENILNGEPELVLKETVLLAQRSGS